MNDRRRWLLYGALVVGLAQLAWPPALHAVAAQRVVRLRNAFISAVKNRAAVEDDFRVDHVKPSINPVGSGGEDGDLHVSGRPGTLIALPMVAEVVNAKLEKDDVVQSLRDLEGTAQKVRITGVWRLWFEHPPADVLVQGGTVPRPDGTNPDHIFELHPIVTVDGHAADESFVPISGYTAYTAQKAFGAYEKLEFRVKHGASFTTVSSTKVGYNYTEFEAVLAGAPKHTNDATFVLADIVDEDGTSVVAKPRRLVIADDTKAAQAFHAKQPKKGTTLRVLGIPRVNLDKLMDEAENAAGDTVVVKGAYEIIVVGIE
ncbi:MAG: hypothetical protein HY270_09260 [Deltaproteobacteria bacterium]|nr:hypothetical protein [Deltaproteobacteria bacterium]